MDEVMAAVLADLRASRRYGSLAPAVLERTARWAAGRARDKKDAIKSARRKLHQIHGAFVSGGHLGKAEAIVAAAPDVMDPDQLAELCRAVLACHTSTMQRLAYAEELYQAVRELAPEPRSIIDLGCGLNPFSVPFMGLTPGARYTAIDLDTRVAALVTRLDPWLPIDVRATAADLVSEPPSAEADLVLLLNTIPSLEQQEPGAARRLLETARGAVTIVTMPSRSLCRRGAMSREAGDRMVATAVPEGREITEVREFPHERLYVLR